MNIEQVRYQINRLESKKTQNKVSLVLASLAILVFSPALIVMWPVLIVIGFIMLIPIWEIDQINKNLVYYRALRDQYESKNGTIYTWG